MIIPPWAKYLAILAIAVALYGKGYADGKEAEQNRWLKQEVVALEAKRVREVEMQAQVDAAGFALSVSEAERERLTKNNVTNVRTVYATRPDSNLVCLDPSILRAVKESDATPENPGTPGASPE